MAGHVPAGFMPGLQSSEAYYPNTTARLLRGAPWARLLSRIGDALMMHLLLHGSIFLPLPNGCFLQASGMPAPQVRCKGSARATCGLPHFAADLAQRIPAMGPASRTSLGRHRVCDALSTTRGARGSCRS